MGLYRIWARYSGFVVVMAKGAALEKLLNLASANGIYLWDIKRYRPDLLVFSTGLRGFRALHPILRRTRCRARIASRRGLPFLQARLARRKGFILGLCIFLAILMTATRFIWRVDLEGLKYTAPRTVRVNLRKFGLYEGVLRGKIDKDMIQRELEVIMPDLAWIGIEIRGMVAVVSVVERTRPPAMRPAGDLIASRDGLVTKVAVTRGTAVVQEGQTVRAGQLLVSGLEVDLTTEGKLVSRAVPATAKIEARVWDEARSCVPLAIWRNRSTGKKAGRIQLRIGGISLSFGAKKPPFQWFRVARRTYGCVRGRNTLPLVEVIIDRYYEERPVLRRRLRQTAAVLGEKEARRLLSAKPLLGGQPGAVQCFELNSPGWVEILASRESIQDIAQTGALVAAR